MSSDNIATLDVYVSSRIQELARANERQAQVTVPDHTVKNLLTLADLDTETVLSRKRGIGLEVTVRSPKGAEIPLLMADTHAIWFSHQRDPNAQTLLRYLVQKGGGTLPVTKVEAKALGSGKRRRQVTLEDMGDCPV